VRLLPAFIFVVIIFLAGLFFLQGRKVFRGAPSGQIRKALLFVSVTALLALFGLLFMFLGKLALLIALVTLAIFFLSRKRA